MRQLIFLSLLLLVIVNACKSKKDNPTIQPEKKNIYDTSTFYDVKGFFESEINDVKASPYFISSKIIKDNKKKDSVVITTKDFVAMSKQFLENDIAQKEIKHFYKEDIFRDLSTKSITFSYTTKNQDLEIQNLDVLLNEETNKVKFVFIRTIKKEGDRSVFAQMNWYKGNSFLINTTVVKNDGTKSTTQQEVNWHY